MTKAISDLIAAMRANPKDVRFADALSVSQAYFGPPRKSGSHHVFKMRWAGDPRINLQEDKNGKAKAYQVRQILQAIDKLDALKQAERSREDG